MNGPMKANAEFGFNSIGAVATQKMQSTDLNLGMPSAYQSVYAAAKIKPRYFPQARPEPSGGFWIADPNDPEAMRHESNMEMAHHMVRAAVQSKASSTHRLDKSFNAMGYQPKPVLGQRIFANPSYGAIVNGSARMDQNGPWVIHQNNAWFNEMKGGVLTTRAGYEYGKARLASRVQELNAIDRAKQAFSGDTSAARENTESIDSNANSNSLLELNLYLQNILDAVNSGQIGNYELDGTLDVPEIQKTMNLLASRAVPNPKDVGRVLKMVFSLAPIMDQESLDQTVQQISAITGGIGELLDKESFQLGPKQNGSLVTVQTLFVKLSAYLQKIKENFNLSSRAKQDLSRNLVKSLGFARDLRNYKPTNPYNALLPSKVREYIKQNADYVPIASKSQGEVTGVPEVNNNRIRINPTRARIDRSMLDALDDDIGSLDRINDDLFDDGIGPLNDINSDLFASGRNRRGGNRVKFDREPHETYGYNAGQHCNSGGRGFAPNWSDNKDDDEDRNGRRLKLGRNKLQMRSFFDPATNNFNIGRI